MTHTIYARYITPTNDPADNLWLASAEPFDGASEYKLVHAPHSAQKGENEMKDQITEQIDNILEAQDETNVQLRSMLADAEQIRADQADTIERLRDELDNAQITIHLIAHKEDHKSYIGCPACKDVRELAGVTK